MLRVAGRWLLVFAALVTLAGPARSAESLLFNYGPFGLSLPVADLDSYVQTGKVSDKLAYLINLAGSGDLASLRNVLITPLPVNLALVSRITYSPVGERVLQRLGSLLPTEAGNSSFHALRAALLLGAGSPGGLTLLSFLQSYPLTTLKVDVSSGEQVGREVASLFDLGEVTFSAVEKQAEADTVAEPPAAGTADPRQTGPFRTEVRTLSFNNPRYAQAEDWLRLASTAQITADVYLPVGTARPAPLIVISHGVASDRRTFGWLAQHLASWGFAVAALDHPGSDKKRAAELFSGVSGSGGPGEFIARPQYISALLDKLERLSRTDPAWQGRLNASQSGIVGHSMGGYTALTVGGATIDYDTVHSVCDNRDRLVELVNSALLLECGTLLLPATAPTEFRDERIKAVFAINPIGAAVFGRPGMGRVAVPTLMVSANKDAFARPELEQFLPFSFLKVPQKYLVLARNATHFTPTIDPGQTASVLPIPKEFVGPDPASYFTALRAVTVAFFKTQLAGEPSYAPFLQQGYVGSLSQPPYQFSSITSLDNPQIRKLLDEALRKARNTVRP
ncbi:alpha/beta hydrolase [Gloeobacter kilaueensis]|uniref:Dienelactone hydrolase n=1 Tax=Gloeobacter kilaueensis (strain ATCC BAA-2537 / CCAP 1431/1 / ULC 316 / JS1) TaxID=1183438 RepID=U5QKA2_GLOK1|nr:alpha/beta hydrolase [Gloeobacter kilaueensis]AGY59326.1 dienelactone hydrolase [Gloeobacter kilaueensis JS1]